MKKFVPEYFPSIQLLCVHIFLFSLKPFTSFKLKVIFSWFFFISDNFLYYIPNFWYVQEVNREWTVWWFSDVKIEIVRLWIRIEWIDHSNYTLIFNNYTKTCKISWLIIDSWYISTKIMFKFCTNCINTVLYYLYVYDILRNLVFTMTTV